MILFTQSTAVLHKYLNDELKILCLLQFFPEVAQNSLSFPCLEKSLSIPGLRPPCYRYSYTRRHCHRITTTATSIRLQANKGKGPVLDTAQLTRWTHAQERFTVSEVAADWHELMIPQRIMRPSMARASEQLDPRCSMQTYHRPNQLH